MMPVGSGIDIVDIQRIEKIYIRHGQHFAKKLLHDNELIELKKTNNPAAFIAKRFAAKEATVKALGVGIGHMIAFTDIYVDHDALGKPLLKFSADCTQKLKLQDKLALLTISDEKSYAVAHVLLFTQ
jgi:holo-[acyl-carrier protein] synthase